MKKAFLARDCDYYWRDADYQEMVRGGVARAIRTPRDGGQTWETVIDGVPVSLVEVTADGSVYAFVLGRGLVRTAEADMDFKTVSDAWGDQILLHLAVDPADKDRIFAASHQGDILASTDGGANWAELGH